MGNIWGAGYFQTVNFLHFTRLPTYSFFFPSVQTHGFPLHLRGYMIVSLFWHSDCAQFDQWKHLQVASVSFYHTYPHHPLSTVSLFIYRGFQRSRCSLLTAAWTRALLQGALAPFSREEGSETKVWVLDWARGHWAVIASGTSQQIEGRNISECVCFCIYTYMRPWAHVDISNSNSTDQNSF